VELKGLQLAAGARSSGSQPEGWPLAYSVCGNYLRNVLPGWPRGRARARLGSSPGPWGRFETPKSRSSKRTIELGPRALEALQEQWADSHYRAEESVVFGHPQIGSPLDASKLTKCYFRPALKRAGIVKPFRPWHDLRHTALTHEAAAGNPAVYVQLKAGHSQSSITERYVHAAQVLFPGAAAKGEARTFSEVVVESL
jgi:integrase